MKPKKRNTNKLSKKHESILADNLSYYHSDFLTRLLFMGRKLQSFALVLFCISLLFSLSGHSQVKIGSNPTSINSNKNLEIEATSGKKVNVNKNDGRTYIENKPSAALTDSVVLRYTDGELRQMSVARLVKFIQDSEDTDGDGIPNGTDPDDDGDGIQDTVDKCPLLYGCASNPVNGATHGCPVNCFTVPGAITALNCSSATNNGILTNGTAASGVTSVIGYTGGNGGAYTAQSISSTGVTGLTASITAGSFTTGSGTLTVAITGTPSGSGTASFALSIGGQSCTFTRSVNAVAPTNAAGTGSLSGRTCFDIALSNDNTNSCGALSGRLANQANFTLTSINTQTYTFTPSGTVSNVRFVYVNTNGAVITSLSGGNTGNNITTAVTATVNYNTSLNSLALGLTSSNPLTADIYVVYNDGATNNGTDRQLKLTTNVKDCACCGAYVSATVWKEFLCHNLGADITLDPHVPVVGLQGAYIQWGKRGPNTTGDSRIDWQTAANNGALGFAAAPTASNANAGSISGWSTTAAADKSWNIGTDTAPVKGSSDPCPAGYRVPTQTEWTGVNNNNTVSRTGTWVANITEYGSALHYGPNVSSKFLTLPASGIRFSSNGSINGNRGSQGQYWASLEAPITAGSSTAYMLNFTQTILYNNYADRLHGLSVRCIKE